MIFTKIVTIPKNTTKKSPKKITLKVTHAVVHKIEIEFPDGCRKYVHVVINRGGHQVWPTNPAGSFAADGRTITEMVFEDVNTPPYEFDIIGWSPNTTYQHRITVQLSMLKKELLMPSVGLRSTFESIARKLFGGSE